MIQTGFQVHQTFDGLSRQQLLIYAQELGEHRRREWGLENNLSQREQQIRDMAGASIAAQEEERQRIAFEVHDRIAQTLVSAFQLLQTLESMTLESPQTQQVAARASGLLREAIRESRNIMNDLRPPVLDEFGIVPLIEEELRHFREDTECQVELNADYPQRLPHDVEIALYRIFHEALINIRRHGSNTRKVNVSLSCGDHVVTLQILDDGSGFDVEVALQAKRVGGLMSMRRRAEIIGGRFELTSAPGTGTRATILVPLNVATGKEGHGSN